LSWPKFGLIKPLSQMCCSHQTNLFIPKLAAVKKLCGELVVLTPMATTSTSAKIRLVQFGAAKQIETKLLKAIEDVLTEYRK
jgi:hypothetical protein